MLVIIVAILLNLASATDYCKLCENGAHTMCKFKEGPADSCINYTRISLTPGEKRYIIDIHNDVRNHVASGDESRGALGNQPSAADMFSLDWDDELAEIAQRWADQCISVNASTQHDKCKGTERFDVGQNIVTAVTSDGELPELSLLILNWYQQIAYVIPSDVDDFIGTWRANHFIGQYTQLVWAKTKYVGCAAAAFKEATDDLQYNIRFICNYGPAGNVIGQPIYERGKPCSRCPQKVCDKLRYNLCSGGKKAVDIKKQKTQIYKKYKDKATTMSNLIDIMDTKKNTSRFLNPILLNSPEVLEPSVNVTNTSGSNNVGSAKIEERIDNLNLTSGKGVGVLNTTESNLNKWIEAGTDYQNFSLTFNNTYVTKYGDDVNKPNHPRDFTHPTDKSKTVILNYYPVNYINEFGDISISGEENLQNISHPVFHTTSANNSTKEGYANNFVSKVRFVSNVKLLIDDFFNQSIYSDLKGTKSLATDHKSIIDLTKDKCEKQVKLDGVVLVQNCNEDSKHSGFSRKTFRSHPHRRLEEITVKGDNVILPGNRRFRRATGTWHHGHCRCVRYLRTTSSNTFSSCTNLSGTYFSIYSALACTLFHNTVIKLLYFFGFTFT